MGLYPSNCLGLALRLLNEAVSFSFSVGYRCYWQGSDGKHPRRSGFELVHKFQYTLQNQGSAAMLACDSWPWKSASGRSRSRRTWILEVALDISSWTGRPTSSLVWYGVSNQASLHHVVSWGSWCKRKSSIGVSQTWRGSSPRYAAGFRDSAIACCIAANIHSSGIWPSPRIRMAKENELDLWRKISTCWWLPRLFVHGTLGQLLSFHPRWWPASCLWFSSEELSWVNWGKTSGLDPDSMKFSQHKGSCASCLLTLDQDHAVSRHLQVHFDRQLCSWRHWYSWSTDSKQRRKTSIACTAAHLVEFEAPHL